MTTLTSLARASTHPARQRMMMTPPTSAGLLDSAPDTGFRPMRRASWYKRVQAWAISRERPHYDGLVAARKLSLFSSLSGTVLEIGPGAGANLPFFRTDARWIGVEPNPFVHPHLHDTAIRLGRVIEVRTGAAERLPVSDHSVDAVVGTLVLCSVHDQAAALREVLRVLRPGGRFVFMEHVAARAGSARRLAQRLARPFWSALADGCHIDRDTTAAIFTAGFRDIIIQRFDLPIALIGPHIAGTAWAP